MEMHQKTIRYGFIWCISFCFICAFYFIANRLLLLYNYCIHSEHSHEGNHWNRNIALPYQMFLFAFFSLLHPYFSSPLLLQPTSYYCCTDIYFYKTVTQTIIRITILHFDVKFFFLYFFVHVRHNYASLPMILFFKIVM